MAPARRVGRPPGAKDCRPRRKRAVADASPGPASGCPPVAARLQTAALPVRRGPDEPSAAACGDDVVSLGGAHGGDTRPVEAEPPSPGCDFRSGNSHQGPRSLGQQPQRRQPQHLQPPDRPPRAQCQLRRPLSPSPPALALLTVAGPGPIDTCRPRGGCGRGHFERPAAAGRAVVAAAVTGDAGGRWEACVGACRGGAGSGQAGAAGPGSRRDEPPGGCKLVKYWSNTGQIQVEYWSKNGSRRDGS